MDKLNRPILIEKPAGAKDFNPEIEKLMGKLFMFSSSGMDIPAYPIDEEPIYEDFEGLDAFPTFLIPTLPEAFPTDIEEIPGF